MKSASMLINPTAYFNGYKSGVIGLETENPYNFVESRSKYEDWQDGYNDGLEKFKEEKKSD
jgi:ribosome modulation factor